MQVSVRRSGFNCTQYFGCAPLGVPSIVQMPARCAGTTQHPWDSPVHPRRRWENSDSDDSDDELDPETNPAAAGQAAIHMLFDLYATSSISAGCFCVLCYYLAKAGLGGLAAVYAKAPGAPSGRYQEHLDAKLGYKAARATMYDLYIRGRRRHDIAGSSFAVKVRPIHEVVAANMADSPDAIEELEHMKQSNELPQSYFEHPVVRGTADPVVPLSMFLDGLPYSLSDSVLGAWVKNEVTKKRFLVALLRKKLLCRCGCGGWCSLFPLLYWIRCCFAVLASGVYPDSRHDGRPWQASDTVRAEQGGESLGFKACLLWLKSDWSEFGSILAVQTWSSRMRPCFLCNAFGPSLYDPSGFSLVSSEWHMNEDHDFDAACKRCEVHVVICRAMHARLLGLLIYLSSGRRRNGRCLRADFPPLGLRQGDRLEPTPYLPDIGEGFDDLVSFPVPLLFWRCTENTLTTHRSPLLDERLGIGVVRSSALDLLHTLYLGPMQVWAQHVLWALLKSPIWGEFRQRAVEQSVACMRTELMNFYAQWRSSFRPPLTECSDMNPKMLGTAANPHLKSKAAETYGLVWFCLFLLERFRDSVRHSARYLEGGRILTDIVAVLHSSSMNMERRTVQDRLCVVCACDFSFVLLYATRGFRIMGSTSGMCPHRLRTNARRNGQQNDRLLSPAHNHRMLTPAMEWAGDWARGQYPAPPRERAPQ